MVGWYNANELFCEQNGTTALMLASELGRVAAARLLLSSGADTNAADADGWTPLAFAARGGHIAIAKDLLDASAKVDSRDCVSITSYTYLIFTFKPIKAG